MEVKLHKLSIKKNQEPLNQPHPHMKFQNTPKYQCPYKYQNYRVSFIKSEVEHYNPK